MVQSVVHARSSWPPARRAGPEGATFSAPRRRPGEVTSIIPNHATRCRCSSAAWCYKHSNEAGAAVCHARQVARRGAYARCSKSAVHAGRQVSRQAGIQRGAAGRACYRRRQKAQEPGPSAANQRRYAVARWCVPAQTVHGVAGSAESARYCAGRRARQRRGMPRRQQARAAVHAYRQAQAVRRCMAQRRHGRARQRQQQQKDPIEVRRTVAGHINGGEEARRTLTRGITAVTNQRKPETTSTEPTRRNPCHDNKPKRRVCPRRNARQVGPSTQRCASSQTWEDIQQA